MRRNALQILSTMLAGVGLLALAGCTGDGDAKTLGPVPTTVAQTTTVGPTTTTTGAGGNTTTTTVRPPTTAATSTTVRPRLVDGVPQVTASPSRAPVGGRVRIEGTGFTGDMWKAVGAPLWLAGSGGCDFFAEAAHSVTVSPAGRLSGQFTVPATGACRMSATGERPVASGRYRIVYSCTACTIGELEVTGGGPTRCADVAFAPNSDNLASDVVATGFPSCAEAEALVRKAGAQLRAVGGPSQLTVDGFTCVRTAESDQGLSSSDFECTSGTKTVTFHRT